MDQLEQRWLESHQLLLQGRFDEGWPAHEWIRTGNPEYKDRFEPTPTFGKPVWQGETEPITLLINADFGMGDTIHFWRFCPLAAARVAKVILRCDDDFKGLFTGVTVIGKEEPLPEFDKVIHMMALPRALGCPPISGEAYLKPNPERPPQAAVDCMGQLTFFKIGVCWSGNPFNPRDAVRSVPIEDFESMFPDPQAVVFSLNKAMAPSHRFVDLRGMMQDWNETAHLLTHLNLVITVDTAIAHLAGALGVPVFLILQDEDPDWRWGLKKPFTNWYKTMSIFRRPVGEKWADLMRDVATCI